MNHFFLSFQWNIWVFVFANSFSVSALLQVYVQRGNEKVDFKPTVSSSIAPNCHCFPPPRMSAPFLPLGPSVCCSSGFWGGFCHVRLYDQVTKEINRKSMFPTFCESVFGVFELVVLFGFGLDYFWLFLFLGLFCLFFWRWFFFLFSFLSLFF